MEYDYKEVNNCELCGKAFNLGRVRHKCKRCHLIICSDCGLSKAVILVDAEKPGDAHRVCNPCTNDINFQKEFEREKETSWNSDSRLGLEWAEIAHNAGIHNDFEQHLREADFINEIQNTIKVIKQELSLGKFDKHRFNYSLLEFLHYSQAKTDRDYARVHIENVLKAFHAKFRLVYNNIIPAIVAFLLTLCSESKAYVILCYLHEKILPAHFWDRSSKPLPFEGFQRERWIFRRLVDDKFSFTNDSEKHFFLKNFNRNIDILLGGLMVNSCNFGVLIHSWNDMICNGHFRHIENYMFKLLWASKPFLERNPELSIRNFQLYACRNFTPQILIDHKGELTYEDQGALEFSWDEGGRTKTVERFQNNHFAYSLLKSLTHEQLKELYLEINKLTEELRAKLGEKVVRETIDLNKRTFSVILEGAVNNVDETQAGFIFDALDVNEAGVIGSRRLLCIILILITQGDLDTKISEIFRMKDMAGRGSIEIAHALQLIDWLGDVLAFQNEVDPTLNFRADWFDLNDKLIRKLKTMKSVGCREITVCINDHPLRNLFLEPHQRDIFEVDYRIVIEHSNRKTLVQHEISLEEKIHRQEELKKIIQEEAQLIMEEQAQNIQSEEERFAKEAAGLNESSTLSTVVSSLSAAIPDDIKEQVVDFIEDKAKDYVLDKVTEFVSEQPGGKEAIEVVKEFTKAVEVVEPIVTNPYNVERIEEKVVVVEEKIIEQPPANLSNQINQNMANRQQEKARAQQQQDAGSCKVCNIF